MKSLITTLSQFHVQFPEFRLNGLNRSTLVSCNIQEAVGEDDDTGEQLIHFAINKMKTTPPSSIELGNYWNDDHALCCIMMINFENDPETYLVKFLWIDPSLLLSLGKSVNNISRSKQISQQLSLITLG